MNLEKELTSQTFYTTTNQTAIEAMLDTIKSKIQHDNVNWRIDLVPLSSPASTNTHIPLPLPQPRPQQQRAYDEPQQQQHTNYTTVTIQQMDSSSNSSSVNMTFSNQKDLKQKLKESQDNEQRLQEQIKELRSKITNNESIYNYKLKEESKRHKNEMKVLEKEMPKLKKRLEQAEYVVKIINQADIGSMPETDCARKRQERLHLLTRKLKLTEYKLQVREQELQALHATKRPLVIENDQEQEEEQFISTGDTILQQSVKRQQSMMMHENKKRRMALDSLGSLANKLLLQQKQQPVSKDYDYYSPSDKDYHTATTMPPKEIYPSPASISVTVAETISFDNHEEEEDKKKKPKPLSITY